LDPSKTLQELELINGDILILQLDVQWTQSDPISKALKYRADEYMLRLGNILCLNLLPYPQPNAHTRSRDSREEDDDGMSSHEGDSPSAIEVLSHHATDVHMSGGGSGGGGGGGGGKSNESLTTASDQGNKDDWKKALIPFKEIQASRDMSYDDCVNILVQRLAEVGLITKPCLISIYPKNPITKLPRQRIRKKDWVNLWTTGSLAEFTPYKIGSPNVDTFWKTEPKFHLDIFYDILHPSHADSLDKLVELGATLDEAAEALLANHMDLELAANHLLSGLEATEN